MISPFPHGGGNFDNVMEEVKKNEVYRHHHRSNVSDVDGLCPQQGWGKGNPSSAPDIA